VDYQIVVQKSVCQRGASVKSLVAKAAGAANSSRQQWTDRGQRSGGWSRVVLAVKVGTGRSGQRGIWGGDSGDREHVLGSAFPLALVERQRRSGRMGPRAELLVVSLALAESHGGFNGSNSVRDELR
jgi:hypothetical protein